MKTLTVVYAALNALVQRKSVALLKAAIVENA
jgi:hypothetical protein